MLVTYGSFLDNVRYDIAQVHVHKTPWSSYEFLTLLALK